MTLVWCPTCGAYVPAAREMDVAIEARWAAGRPPEPPPVAAGLDLDADLCAHVPPCVGPWSHAVKVLLDQLPHKATV